MPRAGKASTKLIDISGERFGKLVVIGLEPFSDKARSRSRRWICQCDCGGEARVHGHNLRKLHGTRKCPSCPRDVKPNRAAAFRQLWNQYIQNAKNKGKPFTISEEEFRGLTKQNCHYCGLEPSQVKNRVGAIENDQHSYTYNGVDRIDSARGYEPGNVVACCRECNRAKMDRNYDEFMDWIRRLAAHNGFVPAA